MVAKVEWRNRIISSGVEAPDQLLANPFNARIHPKPQQDALSGVLNSVGWIAPVIVNQRTGHVIDGHLRVSLALSRGEKTIPVDYVDLDENEEKILLASFDYITSMAVYDREAVDTLLKQVNSDDNDVQVLLAAMGDQFGIAPDVVKEAPDAQLDRAEELRETWQTALGQLWLIGNHRLLCGDSTDAGCVERLIDGKRPDILINDPPYGMRLDADFSDMKSNLKFATEKKAFGGRRYDNVTGDHSDYNASSVQSLFEDVKEQFWFGADYYSSTLIDTMHSGSWLVWDKRLTDEADLMFGSCFELIWSKQAHKRDILRIKWAGVFGVEQEPERKRYHPNHKPVALYHELLTRYSKEGDLLVDCYGGAGSSLIAGEQLNRRCYMMELEPKYCAVILQRMADMGLEPRLIE